jgi:hypothetical protein
MCFATKQCQSNQPKQRRVPVELTTQNRQPLRFQTAAWAKALEKLRTHTERLHQQCSDRSAAQCSEGADRTRQGMDARPNRPSTQSELRITSLPASPDRVNRDSQRYQAVRRARFRTATSQGYFSAQIGGVFWGVWDRTERHLLYCRLYPRAGASADASVGYVARNWRLERGNAVGSRRGKQPSRFSGTVILSSKPVPMLAPVSLCLSNTTFAKEYRRSALFRKRWIAGQAQIS